MKSSPITALRRAFLPALTTLAFLAACACPGSKEGPSPGTGDAPAATGGGGPLTMSVTVNAADVSGRRSAAVRLETPSPMPDGQLSFEIPKECRVVAGAAVRPVKKLGQGAPVSQEIQFECPAGVTGVLKATFRGTDAAGAAVEKTAEGAIQ